MRYLELLEGYKEAQIEFEKFTSKDEVVKTINDYKTLVNKNQVQGNERNIDWWRKQGWDKFKPFVDEKSQQKTITQIKRKKIPGNSITLEDSADWFVVVPLDKDASCFHGKNTDWCVSKPFNYYFEKYVYLGNVIIIFCIRKSDMEKWAIVYYTSNERLQFFDKKDTRINKNVFIQQTGLNPATYVDMVKKQEHSNAIEPLRDNYKEFRNKVIQDIKNLPKRTQSEEIENDLLKLGELPLSKKYLLKTGRKNFRDAVQKLFLEQSYIFIPYINNPKNEYLLDSIKKAAASYYYIENPTEEMKQLVVSVSASFIADIEDPSEEVQLIAVNKYPDIIRKIKNPTEKVKDLAKSLGANI